MTSVTDLLTCGGPTLALKELLENLRAVGISVDYFRNSATSMNGEGYDDARRGSVGDTRRRICESHPEVSGFRNYFHGRRPVAREENGGSDPL